jgi:hypothetical protein
MIFLSVRIQSELRSNRNGAALASLKQGEIAPNPDFKHQPPRPEYHPDRGMHWRGVTESFQAEVRECVTLASDTAAEGGGRRKGGNP